MPQDSWDWSLNEHLTLGCVRVKHGARGSGISVDPERIRAARIEAGLSLRAIAGNDVSPTFIHFVEQGVSRPSRAVLAMIARRTGKSMDYFTADPGPRPEPQPDVAAELYRVGQRIRKLRSGKDISGADRDVLKFIEWTVRHSAELIRSMHMNGSAETNRRKSPPS